MNEPATPEEPGLATPADYPLPEPLEPENFPEEDIPGDNATDGSPGKTLAPSLNGDVPPAVFGPRPLVEPPSIPSWANPHLGEDPAIPADPQAAEPIEPELAPDETPALENPVLLPGGLGGIGPASPSTIPPSELPAGDGTGGVKEN